MNTVGRCDNKMRASDARLWYQGTASRMSRLEALKAKMGKLNRGFNRPEPERDVYKSLNKLNSVRLFLFSSRFRPSCFVFTTAVCSFLWFKSILPDNLSILV
uniref:Uncharacterized protein n=1 Tax=Lotharella globosa TaxID=91324 RepID=A0A7S3YMR1_9EUKA